VTGEFESQIVELEGLTRIADQNLVWTDASVDDPLCVNNLKSIAQLQSHLQHGFPGKALASLQGIRKGLAIDHFVDDVGIFAIETATVTADQMRIAYRLQSIEMFREFRFRFRSQTQGEREQSHRQLDPLLQMYGTEQI